MVLSPSIVTLLVKCWAIACDADPHSATIVSHMVFGGWITCIGSTGNTSRCVNVATTLANCLRGGPNFPLTLKQRRPLNNIGLLVRRRLFAVRRRPIHSE